MKACSPNWFTKEKKSERGCCGETSRNRKEKEHSNKSEAFSQDDWDHLVSSG